MVIEQGATDKVGSGPALDSPACDAAPRPGVPPPETAVALLVGYFLNRTDQLAFDPPWKGNACPAAPDDLEGALRAHLLGESAQPCTLTWYKKGEPRGQCKGYWRLGSYSIEPEGNTARWLMIDCDRGGHHSWPLADPLDTALRILAAARRLGLPAYLERSGGAAAGMCGFSSPGRCPRRRSGAWGWRCARWTRPWRRGATPTPSVPGG